MAGPDITLTNIAATNFTDTSVVIGISYYYVVFAINNSGISDYSSEVVVAVMPLTAPANSAAKSGNKAVWLKWDASIAATSYHVWRAVTSGGPYQLAASVTTTFYEDPGLTNGIPYYYVVSAVDAKSESLNTHELSATPIPAVLRVYLKFDESSGTNAADSSGNAWSASLAGNPPFVAGLSNNSVKLGNGSYVALPSGVVTNLTDFTICAWVNLSSSSYWARVFDFGSGTKAYMFLTASGAFAITTNSMGAERNIIIAVRIVGIRLASFGSNPNWDSRSSLRGWSRGRHKLRHYPYPIGSGNHKLELDWPVAI